MQADYHEIMHAQHLREARMQEAEHYRLVKEATAGINRPQTIRRLISVAAERALRFTRTAAKTREPIYETSEIPALNL